MSFGEDLPRIVTRPPGPASRSLARRLRAVESRDVTFLGEAFPVFWEEAGGANVRDADGNVYVDFTAAFGVALAGHANPRIQAAVAAQAERLVHGMGDVHPPALKVDLLERLARLAPWPDARATLASTGSEAVEIALKTALLATGRPGVVAFEGAYHGLTLGSLAATAREHFRSRFRARLYAGVRFVPFPDSVRGGAGAAAASLSALRRALEEGAPNGDPIGAVIAEPVQGRAGVRAPPPGYWERVAELVHEHGAIVVADEVFTGLGRCGALFASSALGLGADVICLGKALGGGLPLSACLGRADVMDAWPPSSGEAVHTSTFLGHPLACAAAVSMLDLLDEGLAAEAASVGDQVRTTLLKVLRHRPEVLEVRGTGLMIGVEFADARSKEPMPRAGVRVAEQALARGVLVLPAGAHGHVLELTPPVTITPEQVADGVARLADAVDAAFG